MNFLNRLKPGQTTSDDVMDEETGEIFFQAGEDAGKRRKDSKNLYKGAHAEDESDYDIMMWDPDEFEQHYNVIKRDLADLVDDPQMMRDRDYDIDRKVPTKAKRKDGRPLTDADFENIKLYTDQMNKYSPNIDIVAYGKAGNKMASFDVTYK